MCNPPDAVLRHPGKHCITQLVEAKSRRSCHSISNLVIIRGYPQEENKFLKDFPLKLFFSSMHTHQCCSNSSSDSCLGGGWVEVENPSGVQLIDCMTQEKWHTCVDNLDIKGYYDTCIGNIKDTYYEDMKM